MILIKFRMKRATSVTTYGSEWKQKGENKETLGLTHIDSLGTEKFP